ncbi:hypothetical protein CEXT_768361 [Caerostris extrusa]|uniref:Kinesin motor domain-containing protein n=1 Tax=Caerostris extrusa TaxID=172846 RepID=A0AAV4NQH9_CAEEX|nr:hypothetical protein CEXT_768361 [Caerostris extrusa]
MLIQKVTQLGNLQKFSTSMASETVKVIVRCRPINQRERDLGCKVIINMDSSCGLCSIVNRMMLQFHPKILPLMVPILLIPLQNKFIMK